MRYRFDLDMRSWAGLVGRLHIRHQQEHLTHKDFYYIVTYWLKDNRSLFGKNRIWDDANLEVFVNAIAEDDEGYQFRSEDTVEQKINHFTSLSDRSLKSIANYLMNELWSIVVFTSQIPCDCCGCEFDVFSDKNSKVFLSCKWCGFERAKEGDLDEMELPLLPADLDVLRMNGFLSET